MKHIAVVVVIVLSFITLFANSQTKLSRREYIETYKLLAIREMHRTGIPASIKMAQACLESSNGNSQLSVNSNNHFGIKCKTDWTGGRVYHDDDEANECFRKYLTVEESYIDHSDFLVKNVRYASLFNYDRTDYVSWAKGLKAAGYATEPAYAERLIKIIEDEQLYLLDKVKPGDMPELAYDPNDGKIPNAADVKKKVMKSFDNFTLNPYDQRPTIEANGLTAIRAMAGDTYESIAREFDLKDWEITTYNDLDKDAIQPEVGALVYLERKRFSAPKGKDKHTVKPGESLWSISQDYGVRLKSLIRKNHLSDDEGVKAGEQLYLRKRKPKKQ